MKRTCSNCKYYSNKPLMIWGIISENMHLCTVHPEEKAYTAMDSWCFRWEKRKSTPKGTKGL